MTEPKDDKKDEKKEKSTISMDDAVMPDMLFSAEAMIAKDDLGTAIKILKDMIKTDEKNADLHFKVGKIARQKWKNFEQARDAFQLAVKYDPNHTLALFALADLQKNQFNNYDEAKKCWEQLLKVKPAFGIGWKEYADLLGWRMGDWENAVKCYEESVKFEHRYLWNCYNNCAWGLANKLGDYEKSKKYYQKSLELNNNNITWANYGKLYMDFIKDDIEAEKCFRKSLSAKETTSGAHVFLGQVLAKRIDSIDSIEEAKKHLIRSLELGDTRGKQTLEEIIKREKAEQIDTTIVDSKVDNNDEKKEEKKIEFFSNTDRIINILDEPTEALIASADNKILCSGDAFGKIIFYDMVSLKDGNFNNTVKYDFFCLEKTNCNEIQFSNNGKYLAAAFYDQTTRYSKLMIFDIEAITINGLNGENILKCNKPISNQQMGNKINTNAMQFTSDDKFVLVGLQMYYPSHVPFFTVDVSDSKLNSDIYSKVFLKQCSLQLSKMESISALDLQGDILIAGSTLGRVFIIDIKLFKLLYTYSHREITSIISSVFITGDMRWIISSDVYGVMNFYRIRLKGDKLDSKNKKLKTTIASKIKHNLILDIQFVCEFVDIHFRQVSELQGYNDKLICSGSHDGNIGLFELINDDMYTGQSLVRVISRVESSHEYLAINTTSWIVTNIGLCLFTGGDDKRIIIHGLTDILLDALPTSLNLKKHKHHKIKYFNISNLDESKKSLLQIIEIEKHKLNGWINLWAFDHDDSKQDLNTIDMVSSALGTLQILTEPVILNLIEDKVKYERVFSRMGQDANDISGLKQINNLIDNIIKKQKYYDTNIKQLSGDLIQLMCDATQANKQLQKLAIELSSDPVVSGMYEGNPGIKKMKRAVEKSLLKNLERTNAYDNGFEFKKELNFSFLKDLSRAGITLRDCKAIYAALNKIINVKKKEIQIVRMKNRFVPESELGYRDILLNLKFIDDYEKGTYKYNGHIVELQLHHEKYQNVRKKGKGHANYAATRFMMDFIKISTKKDIAKNKNIEKIVKHTPQQAIKNSLNELWNV